MEREFKFRFWIIKERKMLSGDDLFSVSPDLSNIQYADQGFYCNNLNAPPDHKERLIASKIPIEDEFVPMQYCGLKDKNGKEIYEGDIVEWWDSYGVPELGNDSFSDRAVVNFEGGMFQPVCGLMPNVIEVIGNIYSNPELINKATS